MNQRRLFRSLAALSVSAFFSVLTACGGGGSASAPATSTPAAATPAPSTSSGNTSGADLTQTRATILSATQAAVSGSATTALPTTSGGEITLLPFEQYWGFTLTADNKIFGLSRPSETVLIDPTQVKKACLFAGRVGWGVSGGTSVACGPMLVGEGSPVPNYAKLPRTCNNDRGTYAVVLKGALKSGKDGSNWDDWEDGEVLWGDFASERKFTFRSNTEVPMQAAVVTSGPNAGLIEYGLTAGGYQQAKVGVNSAGDLKLTFGSNCLGGFGKNSQLTDLDPTQAIMYAWNSNDANAKGQAGWGVGSITPTTKIAYQNVDPQGNYEVVFTGVKCGSGNVTVYKGTGPSNATVWNYESDFFGAGWLIIQKATDPIKFWEPGAGVTFQRDTYQIQLPAC